MDVMEMSWPTLSIACLDGSCGSASFLTAALCITAVVAGATFAYIGARRPAHRGMLETVGGFLLIGGFALLGYSLERLLGSPLP